MPTYVPWGFLEQTSPPPSPCALGEGGSRKHSENERAGATSLHRAAGGGLSYEKNSKVCTQLRIFLKEIKSTLNQELIHILGERG
jgi:hypothetical protein